MKKIKAALLPLYIKLYDDAWPELRERFEAFYDKTADIIDSLGFEVIKTAFCRLESEFKQAVAYFESQGADCIVTLHLAYSPSLESSAALSGTKLPIIVFDTTQTFDFSPEQSQDEILYNHGIHGVMDMCALLRQNGKNYAICAGYYEDQTVKQRLSRLIRAAAAARAMSGMRTGALGVDFAGMGDFKVSDAEIKSRLGVETVRAEPALLRELINGITDDELEKEMSADCADFESRELDEKTQRASTRSDLAVRKWLKKERLGAFTANFLGINKACGLDSMPFLEASKAMARGIGYAGEGDVLTASLVGALLKGFPDTSFVEIFCPDWKSETLFLSHMGEVNLRVTQNRILTRKPFPFTDAADPAALMACMCAGDAVYVNISREKDSFKLVLSEVEMCQGDDGNFAQSVRGWMSPRLPISVFLEKHSALGATHHSALVYGADACSLSFFGELLGLPVYII